MTRKEVREFLQSGVNALTQATEFGAGRVSEFASKLNRKYPAVWQVTSPMSSEQGDVNMAPMDRWEIHLLIAMQDKPDSTSDQYEAILDDCDLIAQKLLYKYRNIVSGYKLTTIEDIKREPFIKRNSPDCTTGIDLTFVLVAVDKTNVC